jgi:hypothetical protein
MPAPIDDQTRKQVIQQWISGDNRDKIAIDNGIGEGTVSGIVNDWKKGLEASEYESVRELAVQSKKQGLALSDLASGFRLARTSTALAFCQPSSKVFLQTARI